ncbi:unnamed protein product [Ectocarpus sp. CCAP 1310/34]|nr:unnamed protein product [Ectocarpus sp. CCAP 1310/34]
MDNSMEATTTQRGRQTKTPAKFSQNGSLGAAVGGGGLLPSSQKLLPGITGGAAATNTQSEGGAGRPRKVAATAVPASSENGKKTRVQEMAVVMQDPAFADGDDEQARGSDDSIDVGSASEDDSFTMDPDGDLEMGRGSGGGSSRESVGGSSRGSDIGCSRGSGSYVASAGAPGSAKTLQALQKSIDRNRTKRDEKWPASLLREACSLRKIMGSSKEKDTEKMASRLTQVDRLMEGSSPFFADLDDKA